MSGKLRQLQDSVTKILMLRLSFKNATLTKLQMDVDMLGIDAQHVAVMNGYIMKTWVKTTKKKNTLV